MVGSRHWHLMPVQYPARTPKGYTMKDIFTGKLVRLSAFDPEELSKALPRWYRNSEYFRLLDSSARPLKSSNASANYMEDEVGDLLLQSYYFSIRILAEDKQNEKQKQEKEIWPG